VPGPIALVDCNNFYASCERVFQPALRGRPVVVRDGCVIARSNEAKALGVGMGDPWHLCRDRFTAAGVVVRKAASLLRFWRRCLRSSAPEWARLRLDIEVGHVRPEVDLTPELVEAVTRTADIRGKGMKLDTFLAQQDAFDKIDPKVEDFMRMFYDPNGRRATSAQKIADGLHYYAEQARRVSAERGLDLGLPNVTAEELQRAAIEKTRTGGQGGLFLLGSPRDGASPTAARGEVRGRGFDEARADTGNAGAGGAGAGPGGLAADELALAQRRSGGTLRMERQRPSQGIPDATGGTGLPATVAATPSPQQATAIRSLQQQAFDLADALDFPLREGRVRVRNALGVFNTGTGVVRVKEVPDFEVVAHEGGHALEAKAGQPLTQLTEQFRTELAPLVPNGNYAPDQHVKEGFAEHIRRMIGNPAHAQSTPPRQVHRELFFPPARHLHRLDILLWWQDLQRCRSHQLYKHDMTACAVLNTFRRERLSNSESPMPSCEPLPIH
jgi:hypothetical protein